MIQPDFVLTQGWWYPAVLSSCLLLIVFLMPKKLSWKEIYIIFAIIGYIVWMIDIILAIPFDIFDLGDPQKEGLPEILLFGIIPSCLAVIYLNYLKQDKKWLFVFLFVVISLILEWLTVKVGLMSYNHWNTWWSTPVHLVAYAFFLPWQLTFIRKDTGQR
ncbi:hypothetical protein GCM10007063_00330 [Lentibacillus kapialis]|uniref:Uncharacterized protein n=1 Tax=Lentibacillus kapialis TaxID=340214 RepID=A0A917PKI2_9BACI|nr:hypothetical protein [Lentibacillus kapialis]GGJ81847.1 hypothetical protein GCM10007063_00330 [Lentibacillus kapialis]